MAKGSLKMWMIKDLKGLILPLMGIHFTRREAIAHFRAKVGPWKEARRYGWKIVKVKITQDATERTDNTQ